MQLSGSTLLLQYGWLHAGVSSGLLAVVSASVVPIEFCAIEIWDCMSVNRVGSSVGFGIVATWTAPPLWHRILSQTLPNGVALAIDP